MCDLPAAQCLDWHIQPRLAEAKQNGGGLRARCPVCGDRGLTIGPGENARMLWNCYACEDRAEIRKALIRAGVEPGCLPRWRSTEAEIIAAAAQVQRDDRDSSGWLRVYLILLGHKHWPKGGELVRLAAEIGVSRTRAYDAKKAGPLLSPGAPVPTGSVRPLSSAAGQAANRGRQKVPRVGQVLRVGQQKVPRVGHREAHRSGQ